MKRTDTKSTPSIFDEVDFIFKPMLAINSKIVSTFLCMPVRPISEGYRSGYGCLPISANESQIFDLDVLTLNKGAEALENLFKSDKKSLIAMPIHFETLAKRTRRIQYMELFTKHFGNRERRIIFKSLRPTRRHSAKSAHGVGGGTSQPRPLRSDEGRHGSQGIQGLS